MSAVINSILLTRLVAKGGCSTARRNAQPRQCQDSLNLNHWFHPILHAFLRPQNTPGWAPDHGETRERYMSDSKLRAHTT